MPTGEELEIYKQRYETFRHLDKVRWQMVQIAIAAGSIVLAFGKDSSTGQPSWVLAVGGSLFVILGLAMERIRKGISMNSEVLRAAGRVIGDTAIPQGSCRWKNISFWIASAFVVLGLACITLACIRA